LDRHRIAYIALDEVRKSIGSGAMDVKREHLVPEDFFLPGGVRDCRKWDEI